MSRASRRPSAAWPEVWPPRSGSGRGSGNGIASLNIVSAVGSASAAGSAVGAAAAGNGAADEPVVMRGAGAEHARPGLLRSRRHHLRLRQYRPLALGNHMHDLEATQLQLCQQRRQRQHHARLDVVQQQHALALPLQTRQRETQHLIGADLAPVVGERVRAPHHQRARLQMRLDGRRAAQSGNAEIRRQRLGVAQRGGYRGDAVVDLVPDARAGNAVKPDRMVLAVGADGMAGVVDAAHRGGIGPRHPANQEERRLDAFFRQDVEHAIGVRRQRPIVEGQHHLAVVERQSLPVLHPAEQEIFGRADHQLAADAERVRLARTGRLRRGSAAS